MKFWFSLLLVPSLPLVGSFSVALTDRAASRTPSTMASDAALAPPQRPAEGVAFSHVQLYVDALDDLDSYKRYEERLNAFALHCPTATPPADRRALWASIAEAEAGSSGATTFVPHGRDVVRQLLAGFGFRVTAAHYGGGGGTGTRSVLVTSPDPRGVQILVTALEPTASSSGVEEKKDDSDEARAFDKASIHRFFAAHDNRQGIAVLGFLTESVHRIHGNYMQLHPKLIADFDEANGTLEVFAFYQAHETGASEKVPDTGTILRFVQANGRDVPLPGLVSVPATFPAGAWPAYCDHWVSNVHSRTEFLDTLADTLGFHPKVDFNAGVVAAGEAQIESTVTGNDSLLETAERHVALRDQSQVYLPINNALSSVGHVHGFLREIGQGIQHLASRVEDLVEFVQSANENREVFAEGFTFLNIPRSYYGILSEAMLVDASASPDCARAVYQALQAGSAMEADGAVDLDATKESLDVVLQGQLDGDQLEEYRSKDDVLLDTILGSRYANLYSLLRDHLGEETYLRIVRNKILVDVQGEDLLYQIFTCNILQRNPGDEAPFFEFIQRVCSECLDDQGCPRRIRPGCGGFGIRNFLTLFLSIEVSKAMREVVDAKDRGDAAALAYSQAMVDYFTAQMNESNPILTRISDAMTQEGVCRDKMLEALSRQDVEEADAWRQKMEAASQDKEAGNQALMMCSARYNALMKQLREEQQSNTKTS